VPRVVDGEEPLGVAYAILVLGPFLRSDIAPIAFDVAIDERLWIFLRFDERDVRARATQPTVNRGLMMYTALPPFSEKVLKKPDSE
jgi:hypothetical protein